MARRVTVAGTLAALKPVALALKSSGIAVDIGLAWALVAGHADRSRRAAP